MHIEDYVSGALHAYASEWLGAAPQVQLELRAMADHLGAYLVEGLGLKQEWAVGTFLGGELDDIDDADIAPLPVKQSLAIQQRLDAKEVGDEELVRASGFRRTIMTRLYTDWAEDPEPVLDDEDLVDLVEADGEPCDRPDLCDWRDSSDSAEYVCGACGKTEPKEAKPVVFQDQ